jgi:hypothetical protein
VGNTFHDLQEIHVQELNEPSGWVTILPTSVTSRGDDPDAALRAHFIQVAVLANHQNGRDTHIRQIKISTPRRHLGQHMNLPEFTSVSGLNDKWPPPPPREVTEEELIELGLLERPATPPPPDPAGAGAGAAVLPDLLRGMDPQQLSSLLQLLAQQ